jgi:hypothetical protein
VITREGLSLAMIYVRVVADAIKELGSVPSGHLYAGLMGHMDLRTYNAVIKFLTEEGLVTQSNHLLTWVGDQKTS